MSYGFLGLRLLFICGWGWLDFGLVCSGAKIHYFLDRWKEKVGKIIELHLRLVK